MDDPRAMTGRDRVLTALALREPDRIPIDFWAERSVTDSLIHRLGVRDKEALLQRLGVDLRYVMGPSFGASAPGGAQDETVDYWGVARRPATVEGVDGTGRAWRWTYQHVHCSPLERATTVQELEAWPWPTAERWDYSAVEAECLAARQTGSAVVFGGDRLDRTAQLKPAMYLRGTEQFLSDLLLQPKLAECLLDHIASYYLDYNERVFAAAAGAIDIFFMGDDMGTQTSLWVSPKLYRKFFKARFRAFIELAHRYGIKTMYHSCGNVTALIPDFIDCGLDILQSLQPAALDPAAIKREYGAHLCFQGGIDIQHLPRKSPEEVDAEVAERARTLGVGGGYIFCTAHNLLPDVPPQNIDALFSAYHRHGRYAR